MTQTLILLCHIGLVSNFCIILVEHFKFLLYSGTFHCGGVWYEVIFYKGMRILGLPYFIIGLFYFKIPGYLNLKGIRCPYKGII